MLLADSGYRVRGVDLSERMIERARTKAEAAGTGAEFRVGDAAAPPWDDATFGATTWFP